MSAELWARPIESLAPAIRDGKLSPVALTEAYLDRIARLDERVVPAGRVLNPPDSGVRTGAGRALPHLRGHDVEPASVFVRRRVVLSAFDRAAGAGSPTTGRSGCSSRHPRPSTQRRARQVRLARGRSRGRAGCGAPVRLTHGLALTAHR